MVLFCHNPYLDKYIAVVWLCNIDSTQTGLQIG